MSFRKIVDEMKKSIQPEKTIRLVFKESDIDESQTDVIWVLFKLE